MGIAVPPWPDTDPPAKTVCAKTKCSLLSLLAGISPLTELELINRL